MVKKIVSSFIGAWFVLTPWILGYEGDKKVVALCALLGAALSVFSLLSLLKWKRASIFNWAALFVGVIFIIVASEFDLHLNHFLLSIALGLSVVLLNFYIIFPSGSE